MPTWSKPAHAPRPHARPQGGDGKPGSLSETRPGAAHAPFGPAGWNSVPRLPARGWPPRPPACGQPSPKGFIPNEEKGGESVAVTTPVPGQPLGCDGERWDRSWRGARVPGPRGCKTDAEETRVRGDDEGAVGLPWEEGKEGGLGAEEGRQLGVWETWSVRNNPGEKAAGAGG